MACHGMLWHEKACIIQYSTYTLSLVIFQLKISNISGRWRLHNWTSVTYLDHRRYILGRWRSHIWTSLTYLDGECNISGRLLHIWTVTYHTSCFFFSLFLPVRRADRRLLRCDPPWLRWVMASFWHTHTHAQLQFVTASVVKAGCWYHHVLSVT